MNNPIGIKDTQANMEGVNEYYPRIAEYHKNEIISFFDSINEDFHIKRKTKTSKINCKEDVYQYIREVKGSFKHCMGELPQGAKIENSKIVKTVDRGSYFIDNVLIESLPGYFLTANFYYPKNIKRKAPSILFLDGHSSLGKAYKTYASFCVEAVMSGFCVLTFDPVGQGERKLYDNKDSEMFSKDIPDYIHYLLGQQISLTGDNLTQYMMCDNVRALDYLCSRKEVDTGRISVAGNSGGGQMAAFMGAYDDRIKVVVSSCYITELKALAYYIGVQESEQSVPNFMAEELDITDLIIAAAPKPYFIGSALLDFFPIDGTRDAYIEAKKMYGLLENASLLEIYVSPNAHGFWNDTREKALEFLCRHNDIEFIGLDKLKDSDIPGEDVLNCLESEDVNTFNSTTLQQIIQKRAEAVYPKGILKSGWEELKLYREELKVRILNTLKLQIDSIMCHINEYGEVKPLDKNFTMSEFSYFSEEYMKIHAALFKNGGCSDNKVLIYVGEVEELKSNIESHLKGYKAAIAVEVRGTGKGRHQPGCWFYEPTYLQTEEASYNCNAAMLGKSVLGMRVHDVLSAVKCIKEKKEYEGCELTIYGKGENAITALLASVISDVAGVKLENLLYSYKDIINHRVYNWGPSIFSYGILKNFDIPNLATAALCGKIEIKGFLDCMGNAAPEKEIKKAYTDFFNTRETLNLD